MLYVELIRYQLLHFVQKHQRHLQCPLRNHPSGPPSDQHPAQARYTQVVSLPITLRARRATSPHCSHRRRIRPQTGPLATLLVSLLLILRFSLPICLQIVRRLRRAVGLRYSQLNHLPFSPRTNLHINQPTNLLINQPINLHTNLHINQPTNLLINQPINQPISLLINQPISLLINLLFYQPPTSLVIYPAVSQAQCRAHQRPL